jgi:exopolysaccharide biosynthesis polyprenyl glycosylphosphotransferase
MIAAVAAPALTAMLVAAITASPDAPRELLGLLLAFLAFAVCFSGMGLGRVLLSRDPHVFRDRALRACAAGLALAWLAFRLLPELSPGWPGIAVVGVGAAGLLLAVRPWMESLARPRAGGEGVLILGRGDLAARLSLDLLEGARTERFAGMVQLGERGRDGADQLDPQRLEQLIRKQGITRVVVAEPDPEERRRVVTALLPCRLLGVEVEDAVEFHQRLHGRIWLAALDPERLVFSDGFRITPAYLRLKRCLDVACALAVLILGAPLLAAVALAVRRSSPGPVLYRQERVGQFGRPFELLKFRSMRVDAERGCGPTWARENDDRVTPLGRFLRRFHLDELPQAINVLRGDLSFVGPRPERPCFVEMLRGKLPFYDLRHYVKPGITGWAQVRYPYADSIEDSFEKLQYDLWYAKNVSLGLDVSILARTALSMLAGRGR